MVEGQSNGDLGYNGFTVSLNYFTALPDPSIVSNANLAVIFKSLLKRDTITKEKYLTDFLKLFESQEFIHELKDDLTVMSWVQIYPKLAIDNSRSVRISAHKIQSEFVQLGGKSFARYLKSTVPVWLLGLYDNDRIVSNSVAKCLAQSFQNDSEKIEKIWVIFNQKIINFITTAIVFETSESLSDKRYTKESDLIIKYERVLSGSILMLNKLIDLINADLVQFDPGMESLLNNERVWTFLGTSVNSETMNLGVFKSYLVLIKSMFNSKSTKFIDNFEDVNSQYKLVSKSFIKNVKLKNDKNNIMYSSIILQLWDTLISLTEFSNGPIKVKKNFWEYGGSKSFSRLIDYLKVGHCNLNPIYYSCVLQFFRVLRGVGKMDSFFDFQDITVAETIIIKVFCKQIRKTTGAEYINKGIECLFEVLKLFDINTSEASHMIPIMIFTVLDTISKHVPESRKNHVVQTFRAAIAGVDSESCQDDIKSAFKELISNPSTELKVGGFKFEASPEAVVDSYFATFDAQERFENFVLNVIDILDDSPELTTPKLAFHIITLFITSYPDNRNSQIDEFIEKIAAFIEADFLQEPIQLLISIFESGRKLEMNVSEIVNDCFLKLSLNLPSEVPKFLVKLLKYINFENEKETYPEIHNFIFSLSEKNLLTEDESMLTYKFVNDLNIMDNILKGSDNDDRRLLFIQHASSQIEVDSFVKKDISKVMKVAWENCQDEQVSRFLNKIKQDKTFFEDALIEHIISCHDLEKDFSNIVKFLNGMFPVQKIMIMVETSLTQVSTVDLSIANPLEANIALIRESVDTDLNIDLIILGLFLVSILELNFLVEALWAASLIGEYIDDILFLLPKNELRNISAIHKIRDEIKQLLLKYISSMDVAKLLKVFNGTVECESSCIFFSNLIEGLNDNDHIAFYNARICLFILTTLFEEIDVNKFESLGIPFNKLVSSPLKFAVLVKSASNFISKSSQFERIRNFVFAEVLGIKREDQILDKGLMWITLGINFLNAEEPYEVVNSHRLLMVLKQIENWLDSSIAFEEEFLPLRVQLARFFNGLIVSQIDVPESLYELCSRLTEENLGQVRLATKYSSLRYFTLKLTLTLQKKQKVPEIAEDLMDLLLDDSVQLQDMEVQNHVTDLIHQVTERAYFSVEWPKKLVEENSDRLYSLLRNSKYCSVQRVSVSILKNLIIASQQDFVVDYQLKKTSLNAENEDLIAQLPDSLLKSITEFDYDIETESSLTKYLWSWFLIFQHFEDITFSIRSDYIAQLKEFNLIEKFLEFVFDYVHVGDSKLLKSSIFSLEAIQNYDLKAGIQGDSLDSEIQFLFLHLYYMSTKYYGSLVQFWFKGIRDRQLKQQIERFTVNFVSPSLVTKILYEVTKSKSDLEKRYENLAIKVNSVTGEIKSVYLIDDQTMEMVIKLPKEFPLENVSVEGPLRLGVKEKQWKAWLMAAQSVILLTNGSILDAIEVFNRNVNLHFSGFEDCAICYSILHQDLSLPSKSCPTCSNKFHAACLYKWFKSSGSSTCPLCRSAFNFKARS